MRKQVVAFLVVEEINSDLREYIQSDLLLNGNFSKLVLLLHGKMALNFQEDINSSFDNAKNYYCEVILNGEDIANKLNIAFQKYIDKEEYVLLLNGISNITDYACSQMIHFLSLTERHGIITGTDFKVNKIEEYDEFLKENLPNYSVLPVVDDNNVVFKSMLLKKCGYFDYQCTTINEAIAEFSLRINQFGFSTLRANHIELLNNASANIGLTEYVRQKHKYYCDYSKLYYRYNENVILNFKELFANIKRKPKVLISLYSLGDVYNGTSQHGLKFLEGFYKLFHNKYDISVLTSRKGDAYFGLSQKYKNIYYPDTIDGRYDIGYVPAQIFAWEHLFLLNRHCLRLSCDIQDIISIRCNYLNCKNWDKEFLFKNVFQYFNGITTLSKFSLDDATTYFFDILENSKLKTKVVYITDTVDKIDYEVEKDLEGIPFVDFFIVFGNHLVHKNIDNFINVAKKSKYNFVVIGGKNAGLIAPNIFGCVSGHLSEAFLYGLMNKSQGFIFPSLYEGFGLPVVNALKFGKYIVVDNNAINRELLNSLKDDGKYVILIDKLEDVERHLDFIVEECKVEKVTVNFARSWDDVATDIEVFLSEMLEDEIDYSLLKRRYDNLVESEYLYFKNNNKSTKNKPVSIKQAIKNKIRKEYPKFYSVLKYLKGSTRNK